MTFGRPAPDGPAPGPPDYGAFIPGPRLQRTGAGVGPLAGLRVAVKDLIDVEGHVTGCGNPDRAASAAPAERDAWAVRRLLDAGARIVGKTITDEVSLGLLGRNRHLGTPGNPRAADRMPGGSSSGSGVAVGAGLADVGLGSDSGGSIRVPASFLGLWGMRPTHGAIPVEGLMAQSPSLDTVGLLAREAATLEAAMGTLLPEDRSSFAGLVIALDAVAEAYPALRSEIEAAAGSLERILGPAERVEIATSPGLEGWVEIIGTLQSAEFAATFTPWLDAADPRLSWGVAKALADAVRLEPEVVAAARAERERLSERLDALLGHRLLCLPTTPCPAPHRDLGTAELATIDRRLVRLLCVAGLTGRPQVSMPLLLADGLPVGLSLVGPRGADRAMLALARRISGT